MTETTLRLTGSTLHAKLLWAKGDEYCVALKPCPGIKGVQSPIFTPARLWEIVT